MICDRSIPVFEKSSAYHDKSSAILILPVNFVKPFSATCINNSAIMLKRYAESKQQLTLSHSFQYSEQIAGFYRPLWHFMSNPCTNIWSATYEVWSEVHIQHCFSYFLCHTVSNFFHVSKAEKERLSACLNMFTRLSDIDCTSGYVLLSQDQNLPVLLPPRIRLSFSYPLFDYVQ